MNRKKFLLVGGGGRESALALRLEQDTILYAVISHENPTIVNCVKQSGGAYLVGNSSDPKTVLDFAQKNEIDYVFVSADDPLANGVIDSLLAHDIKAVGGTKEATRIEWDKIYSMEMMQRICPDFTPVYKVVGQHDEVEAAVKAFENKGRQLVVKPQGLTGGKGVKVMPEHLKSYSDCVHYATQLLTDNPGEKVLLVEKLHGIEFTIMGITDGENLVLAPPTYDYPFRLENDLGPGTGGMGCFTAPGKKLPFMSEQDMEDCRHVMQKIIDEIRHKNLLFNGVLNGGFFKTAKGIKFMEFNARFGDPEGLNVMLVLKSSLAKLIESLWDKSLSEADVHFSEQASVIKYLVAHEYPQASAEATSFAVDEAPIRLMGITPFFASCVNKGGHHYETLKKSRVVAFGAVAEDVETASAVIDEAIQKHVSGNLEYRRDIGSKVSLNKLAIIAQRLST